MKIVLFKTFLGLVLCIMGIVAAYIFLDGLKDGSNPLLLAAAVVFIAVGVFCLVRAGKSDATVMMKLKSEPLQKKEGAKNMLERNNELIGDWKKTADARDRLKMLEAAQDKNVL
jgi:hypothetical protein